MRVRDYAIVTAVLAAIALPAAACGAGSSSGAGTAGTASASIRQPYAAYSRCMQTHGAPFWPDPLASFTSRSPAYMITPRLLAQEHGPSWDAALSACAKKAPSQLPFTEAQLAAARTRLLKMTRCLRSHGFPNWPDPEIGPYQIGFLPPRGADPSNPKFQAAAQACHLPGGAR